MRFAASLVGPDRAHDLVSEVVLATLEKRTLASLDHPRAYLMQGVLNRARSSGRRDHRERVAQERLQAEPKSSSVESDFEVNSDLTQAISDLPMRQRAAIYLVYWEDLSPSEAAHFMGVRPGTLRRYLFLSRNKLRRWIDE